jgi:hypothetical protein
MLILVGSIDGVSVIGLVALVLTVAFSAYLIRRGRKGDGHRR